MSTTVASITTSVDGYVTGPDDRPGQGLGVGGERLHYWLFGGPWTYAGEREAGSMGPEDAAFLEEQMSAAGACVVGRGMYDAAGAWGGTNPFPVPLVVVTHRVRDAPDPATGFEFVGDLPGALARAREVAAGRAVSISGGADLIRQALAAGEVDELVVSVAPVVLGGGKRLFEGFDHDLDLRILDVRRSPWVTHVRYGVRPAP